MASTVNVAVVISWFGRNIGAGCFRLLIWARRMISALPAAQFSRMLYASSQRPTGFFP